MDKKVYLAVSGGIDSMLLLHLLFKDYKDQLTVINYHYGDEFSYEVDKLLIRVCKDLDVPLILSSELEGINNNSNNNSNNKEDNWRTNRYEFFNRVLSKEKDSVLIVGHHKTDQLISWIMSRLKNSERCFIPLKGEYKGVKVLRPLYSYTKKQIKSLALAMEIEWIEDPENTNGDRAKLEALLPNLKEAISQMEGVFNKQYKSWVDRQMKVLDNETLLLFNRVNQN